MHRNSHNTCTRTSLRGSVSTPEDGRIYTAVTIGTEEDVAKENNELYQFLLFCKYSDNDPQSNLMAPPSMVTTTSTIKGRPPKHSLDWTQKILEPRGIRIIADGVDINAADAAKLPPAASLKKLGAAKVTCDTKRLAKAAAFARDLRFTEAQWTADIYHLHFLLTNSVLDTSGVRRVVQHLYTWSGKERENVCVPPATDLDRRSSGLSIYRDVWEFPENKTQSNCCYPDHSYFYLPESPNDQKALRKWANLPAFRGGILYNNHVLSGPAYLITEEKDVPEKEVEARQYLTLIASALLYERLLLRSLTDKAQKTSEIPFDNTLCIYVITNCGPVSTIYKMAVRDTWSCSQKLKPNEKAVRYDLNRLCQLDLTTKDDCDELKRWINYIHWWGVTVHNPAVMREGREASRSEYQSAGGWKRGLDKIAFYCNSSGGITFKDSPSSSFGHKGRGLDTAARYSGASCRTIKKKSSKCQQLLSGKNPSSAAKPHAPLAPSSSEVQTRKSKEQESLKRKQPNPNQGQKSSPPSPTFGPISRSTRAQKRIKRQ